MSKNQQKKSPYVLKEEELLEFWDDNKIFEKTLSKDSPNGNYTFYDGPPFATGVPHYGHLVASSIKDVIPRYWTMKGYHVDRKWGWDCHGLPIENIVEKELDLGNKQDIEKLGIGKFNESCRSKVQLYADDWEKIIRRFGRWVDMENDYKTMDTSFMESIWWVFKDLWQKDLIYEGHKSMHICPRCETTLSNFEVKLNYKDIKDLSVIAKFPLVDEENTYFLAWTTTPWTLAGNVALAVGPMINYKKIKITSGEEKGNIYIFAEGLLPEILKGKLAKANNLEEEYPNQLYEEIANLSGRELEGKAYKPLFANFKENPVINEKPLLNMENAYKVVLADFVDTSEGTGIVHIAPAFGEDDLNLGKEFDLPFIQHVKMNGEIIPELKEFAGLNVKDKDDYQSTDKKIIEHLEKQNLIFKVEEYEHSYPFCWRCHTPLLNYATASWFVDVPKIKNKLIANNQKVNWQPEHFKDGRFGNWLEGAREWAISRDRFWGNPLPVWKCDECHDLDVVGSQAELEEKAGEKVEDLHKHFVDKLTWKCEKCGGVMRRVPEVLDCWFESGAMPYASNHYPFENKEEFKDKFPAQFIAEGQDQTRGWFYTLMVLATALFDKPAFENVVVNGIVLAEDGRKMSKSLKNYPEVGYILDKYGADAVRIYVMSSPVTRAEDLKFSEDGVKDIYRKVVVMLWNIKRFYYIYARDNEVKSIKDIEIENLLDKWVLSRLKASRDLITTSLDDYDLMTAGREYVELINDISTWYVRRSRDRFKYSDDKDKEQALAVLRYVLEITTKLIAPYAPFVSEGIYQAVKENDAPESVHLCEWPDVDYSEKEILEKMSSLREVVEDVLAIRSTNNLKVRQPLAEVEVKNLDLSQEYLDILKAEVNVKEVKLVDEFTSSDDYIQQNNANLKVAISEQLKQEGIAREMVRYINLARKKNKLTMSDDAVVRYWTEDEDIQKAVKSEIEQLKKATRSTDIILGDESLTEEVKKVKVYGSKVWIVLEK